MHKAIVYHTISAPEVPMHKHTDISPRFIAKVLPFYFPVKRILRPPLIGKSQRQAGINRDGWKNQILSDFE